MPETTHPRTQGHIPEVVHVQQHECDNLKSCLVLWWNQTLFCGTCLYCVALVWIYPVRGIQDMHGAVGKDSEIACVCSEFIWLVVKKLVSLSEQKWYHNWRSLYFWTVVWLWDGFPRHLECRCGTQKWNTNNAFLLYRSFRALWYISTLLLPNKCTIL